MKRLIIIASTIVLMLSACTKEPISSLEQSTYHYSTEMSNIQYTFYLTLLSPTQGYAVIWEKGNNVSNISMEQIYDIRYTFDGEESGTITFRKEYSEIYNPYHSDMNNYVDTITSSFNTYAGNNKMFIYSTPSHFLSHIELTKR